MSKVTGATQSGLIARIQLGAFSVSRTICHAASAENINNDIEPLSRGEMQGSEAWPILNL